MATKEGDVRVIRDGLTFKRYFTRDGIHPFDEIEWERRDAVIPNYKEGGNAFEQREVEFPVTWSQNATNIVAQKYFRGPLGTPQRESSVRQLVGRVVDTITGWGRKDGYFASDHDAQVFAEELSHLLVNQKAAFNSPVWFNVGVPDTPQQCSACFILAVDDTMSSILNWYVEEGTIFKGGSGSGINLSRLRSSKESLAGGGTASGPVSFMRGADASAGTIKSGGKTRRAAKMVILNVDHPDVHDFIWCKAREEQKARALRDAGFDMDLDGRDAYSIQYQNANNSVRVTDEFMKAYEQDQDWKLKAVITAEPVETVRARALMREIAEAAWECADPGMQYDTTINEWHTCPATGRINASNPCCFVGETLVETTAGPIRFELLHKMAMAGEELPLVRSLDTAGGFVWKRVQNVWVAGHTDRVVEVETSVGAGFRCTPEHRFLLAEGRYLQARDLWPGANLHAIGSDGRPAVEEVESVRRVRLQDAVPVFDLEVTGTHNFCVTSEQHSDHAGVIVHNSEYMHLDNSACNLASLNLMKFVDAEGAFDVKAFRKAVDVVFTAQEIVVGNSDYPTEKIGDNARAFRQLGLGYANLGALLMARGLAYDSDAGRAWAGVITALMTGQAYRTSARIADVMGPFEGYEPNADPMLRVMRNHRASADEIDGELVPEGLLSAARQSWDDAIAFGTKHGYRNAQATVLAPTGTIGLMMDCDTTGIEPELALVKTKKLVGGGTMQFVNQTVPRALERLGYEPDEVEDIVAYIAEHNSVADAPHLKQVHYAVFDTAMGAEPIHYMGHVRMMAAAQPFISGAISKTVNMPEHVTVEEVEQLFVESWKLGLKAVAIYRDNCKVAQPLSADKKKTAAEPEPAELAKPVRKRLPAVRPSTTRSFQVGDAEGYITAGMYPHDGLGEIFLKTSKQGSTLAGVMDAFAIAVSLGLQYGVPLEAFVSKFINMKFEPSGMTNDTDIRFATSLVDYVFRRLALDYLPIEQREALGIRSIDERKATVAAEAAEKLGTTVEAVVEAVKAEAPLPQPVELQPKPQAHAADAPLCYSCGSKMQPAGSCYVCPSCGSTSGCS